DQGGQDEHPCAEGCVLHSLRVRADGVAGSPHLPGVRKGVQLCRGGGIPARSALVYRTLSQAQVDPRPGRAVRCGPGETEEVARWNVRPRTRKSEIQIPKSETNSNDRIRKIPNRAPHVHAGFCIISALDISSLFRISTFEFRI